MKQIIYLAFCLSTFFTFRAAAYSVTWSQGHIHVTVTDSMYQDSAYCIVTSAISYAVNIDSSYVNDSVQFVDTAYNRLLFGHAFVNTSGASPWIFTVRNTTSGGEYLIPATGGYYHETDPFLKVTTPLDTLRYVAYEDSFWFVPCLWGTVSGRVYIDNNSNCVFDAGDLAVNSTMVSVIDTLFGSVPIMTCNMHFGSPYTAFVQVSWMTNYSVSLPSWFSFIFPMSSCYSGPYTFTTLPQTGVDFPLQCTSNIDVQCYALSPDHVRLRTPFLLHPYVTNIGCDTVSGKMTLVKDSRVTYNSSLSTFPADTVRGDTLIWNYFHLSNVSSGAYWNSFFSNVYLTPDTTLVSGDTLCFTIYTNIPSADINPSNNRYSICLPVRYSYDPNSKSVTPTAVDSIGTFPAGTHTLTYTINFQNTGTDYAYNVKIIDTLNSHLDAHSLKILGTSAPMLPKWLAPNVVEFDFNNIMLPDSGTNEPGSHGQVRFSVEMNSGVPAGTPVTNTGYIYFDTNPAISTNTTHNITSISAEVLGVSSSANIKIYPNPASDQLIVENAGVSDLTVLNMNGTALFTQHIANDKATLDISRFPPGLYILKSTGGKNPSVTKFTKF